MRACVSEPRGGRVERLWVTLYNLLFRGCRVRQCPCRSDAETGARWEPSSNIGFTSRKRVWQSVHTKQGRQTPSRRIRESKRGTDEGRTSGGVWRTGRSLAVLVVRGQWRQCRSSGRLVCATVEAGARKSLALVGWLRRAARTLMCAIIMEEMRVRTAPNYRIGRRAGDGNCVVCRVQNSVRLDGAAQGCEGRRRPFRGTRGRRGNGRGDVEGGAETTSRKGRGM